MNINFGDEDKKKSKLEGVQSIHGNYEDMVNKRKQMLPEIEKEVQKLLKNYDGRLLLIGLAKEDENGIADGADIIVTGVGHFSNSIEMTKAMQQTSEELMHKIVEGVKNDPEALKQIMGHMAGELKDLLGED